MSSKKLATLNERIAFLRERTGLSQVEFAERVGMSGAYLSELEKGKKENIGPHIARLICFEFNVNKNWLLYGEGAMEKEPAGIEAEGYEGRLRAVHVYALAGAGRAKELVEPEPVDTIVLPEEYVRPGVVPVRVLGDSMEPFIYNGATVGVDRDDRRVVSGKVYAVWIDYEGAVIKRVFVEAGKIVLKSDNPLYPDFSVPKKNVGDGFIQGRVLWVFQKL